MCAAASPGIGSNPFMIKVDNGICGGGQRNAVMSGSTRGILRVLRDHISGDRAPFDDTSVGASCHGGAGAADFRVSPLQHVARIADAPPLLVSHRLLYPLAALHEEAAALG